MSIPHASKRIRHRSVVDRLRSDIVAGQFRPGARFPTRIELQKRFGGSIGTIQRAVVQLTQEGFVTVRSRQGTFVPENPPHTSVYGLVNLEAALLQPQAIRYWETMSMAAGMFKGEDTRRIRMYERVELHVDDLGYQRLRDDLEHHRLAGVIYTGRAEMSGTPLLEIDGCPRVGLGVTPLFGKLLSVNHDWYQLADRALDVFLNTGRRRVAAVVSDLESTAYYEYILQGAAARGITMYPEWVLPLSVLSGRQVSRVVHLLLHRRQSERPDALFVANDNFLAAAVEGIQAAGCTVPGELDVVSHWNFPSKLECPLPVRLIGFDARQVLETCLAILDQQRQGLQPATMTKIPAVTAAEAGQ